MQHKRKSEYLRKPDKFQKAGFKQLPCMTIIYNIWLHVIK